MRALLMEGVFRGDLLLHALLLNALYLVVGCGLFLWSYRVARARGLILQVGE